jgi:hypothetical protein
MKIRMVQSYRVYRRGQVLPDVPDGMANDWIRRGIAVEDKQAEIETAALEHRTETADATPRKRGRRAVPKPDAPDATNG